MTKMKRLAGIIAAAAGVLTLATAPAATAAPQPTGDGFKTVTINGIKLIPVKAPGTAGARAQAAEDPLYLVPSALDPNKCWDADLNSINRNGTKVQLWDCNDQANHQIFRFSVNPEGAIRFQNYASGRYLDADLNSINANGTTVQLWDFVAGAKNQWWGGTSIPEGYTRFPNAQSGRQLTAANGASTANGTRLILWDFVAGARNQWWGDTPSQ